MKKLFVLLAIVMSFVAVQSVSADEIAGTIDSIEQRPNIVTVDGVDVYGVKINYLANQYNIDLYDGLEVTFEVYDTECSDGSIIPMACNIEVGDVTVALRTCK